MSHEAPKLGASPDALAGLTGTPAEGYDAPGTGPGRFKADARRLRERVKELEAENRLLRAFCERPTFGPGGSSLESKATAARLGAGVV